MATDGSSSSNPFRRRRRCRLLPSLVVASLCTVCIGSTTSSVASDAAGTGSLPQQQQQQQHRQHTNGISAGGGDGTEFDATRRRQRRRMMDDEEEDGTVSNSEQGMDALHIPPPLQSTDIDINDFRINVPLTSLSTTLPPRPKTLPDKIPPTRPKMNIFNRIIGGEPTLIDRYPYMVSMTSSTRHICGGTIIAPDVFLTAAHCVSPVSNTKVREIQVGRYDITDSSEVYESFVVERTVPHPNYNFQLNVDDYDLAVIKVFGRTDVNPVTLDDGSTVNTLPDGEDLTVMGWGKTETSNLASRLLEVTVGYETNSQCEQATGLVDGNRLTYYGFINDAMMCAWGDGKDSCQGDSGGPLILPSNSAAKDVQLGVVSFGIGCANKDFPGVYTRIGHVHDWIVERICDLSDDPPSKYNCPTPAPTMAPTGNKVPIRVKLSLDNFPYETGWLLESTSDPVTNTRSVTYGSKPIFSYKNTEGRTTITETVQVDPNQSYKFTMLDQFGDGMDGTYTLTRTDSDEDLVTQRQGAFLYSRSHTFTVAALPNNPEPPTPPPTNAPPPPTSPPTDAPTVDTTPFITVFIILDTKPEETGWSLDMLSDGVVMNTESVPPGTYTNMVNQSISIRINLPSEEYSYKFTITDTSGNGLCCQNGDGLYQVWLGERQFGTLLFHGGAFGAAQARIFRSTGSVDTAVPTVSPTEEPTESPTVKPSKPPTKRPTKKPTEDPTKSPSKEPTKAPTKRPTKRPTTKAPSSSPIVDTTKAPTKPPTPKPQTPPPTPSPTPNPTAVIKCLDGQASLPNIFCGRGPTRQDCPNGYSCYIDPTDKFAVCCPLVVVETSPPSTVESVTVIPTLTPTDVVTTSSPTESKTVSPTKSPTTPTPKDEPSIAPTVKPPTPAPQNDQSDVPTVQPSSLLNKNVPTEAPTTLPSSSGLPTTVISSTTSSSPSDNNNSTTVPTSVVPTLQPSTVSPTTSYSPSIAPTTTTLPTQPPTTTLSPSQPPTTTALPTGENVVSNNAARESPQDDDLWPENKFGIIPASGGVITLSVRRITCRTCCGWVLVTVVTTVTLSSGFVPLL